MIISIAWRNIWRNKLRSSIIMTAIAIGIFAGVFSWTFYAGMVSQRIDTAIKTEASHIQIHHKKYLADPDIKYTIDNVPKLLEDLKQDSRVKAVSQRILVNGMALSAQTGTGVKIMGINIEEEKKITNIFKKVVKGEYLESGRNPALIGDDLAEKLGVKIRSKIVLYLQDNKGTMIRSQFRVSGIYNTSNSMYDEMNIFVRQKDIQDLIGIDKNAAHEIAILLQENDQVKAYGADISEKFNKLDIKTWKEIMPDVSMVEETFNVSMYIFLIIILMALCFGIVNTMLMAVLERLKELGMLMAVGMNKLRVFSMIVLETIFLSISGGVIGIIVATIITLVFSRRGLDLSHVSKGFESLGYDSIVYPLLSPSIIIQVTILVIIAGFLSSIYPAIKALNLKPADALRIDV